MPIVTCRHEVVEEWQSLRAALWPDTTPDRHRAEIDDLLDDPANTTAFMSRTEEGVAVGFAEATLRHDHVNGCTTSPVAFLEGIYVAPLWRGMGIGRRLCIVVQNWALSRGCREFASDAALENLASHRFLTLMGFAETEKVVCFRKSLQQG